MNVTLPEFADPSQLVDVDMGPALLGGGAALALTLLSTPIIGAVVASYAPRAPVRGALIATGLSLGLGILAAGLAAGGVASSAGTAKIAVPGMT